MKISVIVPVHDGGEKFRRCLVNLQAARPRPHEVIVVVDGNRGSAVSTARDMAVRVISMGAPPRGPAGARNTGAEASTGDILFFVDADVEIHGDCIGMVRNFFQENPDMAAVIGSYDDAPFENDFLSQYKNLFHHYTHQKAHIEASTFWGACGAIRREAFFAVGGFDERFARPCIEDIELGYRLRKNGWRIRLLKNLQVKHLKRWRLRGLLKTDIFDRAIPWTRLILQQQRIPSDLNLKMKDRVSCAAVFGLIFTWPFAFMSGWAWGMMGFLLGLILVLNGNLYHFFWRRHGGVFAMKNILFHCFYLFYSGLAFMFGKTARRGNP